MVHPYPFFGNGGCDYIVNVSRDGHCKDYAASCNGCGPPRWLSDKACGCDCGKCPGFPVAPLPAGATFGADPKVFPYPFPGDTAQHDYSIEDALKVPADLEPGEYVVGYRWDCEATSRAHTTTLLPAVPGHPKLALRSLPCVVQRCGAPAATSPSCRDPQPM